MLPVLVGGLVPHSGADESDLASLSSQSTLSSEAAHEIDGKDHVYQHTTSCHLQGQGDSNMTPRTSHLLFYNFQEMKLTPLLPLLKSRLLFLGLF